MSDQAPLAQMPGASLNLSRGSVSPETQVVRVGLATEAAVLVMGGLMAALLAVMSAVSGPQWLMYAAGAGGIALSMLVLAGLLVLCYRRLSSALDVWKIGVFALEAVLMPLGWWAMSVEAAYQAKNPGDHGPFADGSDAMISVLGFVFAFGAALMIASIVIERARVLTLSRYRRASAPRR